MTLTDVNTEPPAQAEVVDSVMGCVVNQVSGHEAREEGGDIVRAEDESEESKKQ